MIASARGKRPWLLFCSASRTRLLNQTPAKVLQQCIGLVENLTYIFHVHGNHFSARIQRVGKNKENGRVVVDEHTKHSDSGLFLFLFFSSVIVGQSCQKKKKNIKMYLLHQKITLSTTANMTFFRKAMKNNPAKFRFPTHFR